MKDLWCIGAKTTGLNSAMTKPYKYTSEKIPLLFLIYPWGKRTVLKLCIWHDTGQWQSSKQCEGVSEI